MRQNEGHCGVTRGAERAKNIGVGVARIDRRAWPRPNASPAAGSRAFLANAAFVLTPKFDGFIGVFLLDFCEYFREFF